MSEPQGTAVLPAPGTPHGEASTILAYRDRLIPRSELTFLSRLYVGFQRLKPVWIGRRVDEGMKALTDKAQLLGRDGIPGWFDREMFKHFGVLPPVPDLASLCPKLVHAHFGKGGALALPLARALNIPLVVSFYGGDATKDKHYARRWPTPIYQRRLDALRDEAALFLCVSDSIRNQLLSRGFPAGKLLVQRSGVDLDMPETPETPFAQRYVLFAGRFVEKKGAGYVIEAVRRMQTEGRRRRLVMIGEGPMAGELQRAAVALDQVEFRGWMPNRELRQWMRGALALCVPSFRASDGDAEGLPTVVIEAMAAGTPVIGSKHGGIGEAIEDGSSGFLIPENDPEALAAALRRLHDDEALRDQMGRTARTAAIDGFDMVRQSRRLEERLLSVIEANG